MWLKCSTKRFPRFCQEPDRSPAVLYKSLTTTRNRTRPSFSAVNRKSNRSPRGSSRIGPFILHGRSGVGKSSLLRAGIIPRLKTEGHGVLTIRSFTDPLEQMQISLKQNFNFCGGQETLKNTLEGS